MKYVYYLSFLAVLASAPALAQSVHKIGKADTQLLVARDEKGFRECGVRFILSESNSEYTDFYDVNVTALIAGRLPAGKVAGGRMRLTNAEMDRLKGKRPMPSSGPSPVKFWIAKNTDPKPLMPVVVLPDKRNIGALVAVTEFYQTINQIINLADGSTMQFLMQYPRQEERVLEMTAPLEGEDIETLKVCLFNLVERVPVSETEHGK